MKEKIENPGIQSCELEAVAGQNVAALMQIKPGDLKEETLKFWALNLDQLDSLSGVLSYEKEKGFRFENMTGGRAMPVRKSGVVQFNRIIGFGQYVSDQALTGDNLTRIYINSSEVEAVIDDTGDKPGWRKHRAVINVKQEPEFRSWLTHDGTWVCERNFQELIDSVLDSIEYPDADDFLSTIQSLDIEGFKKRSEDTTAEKKESIATMRAELKTEIPKELSIRTRVFEDFETSFRVRIRTRVTSALSVEFKASIINRFEMETQVEAELFRRVKEATGLTPLAGVAG